MEKKCEEIRFDSWGPHQLPHFRVESTQRENGSGGLVGLEIATYACVNKIKKHLVNGYVA
jgi:hypothetical protein